MSSAIDLWLNPLEEDSSIEEMYMIAGWRQWADAGTISSGLPRYLIQLLDAEKIGELELDDSYMFQIPGTHDLVRPTVKMEDGYPESLEIPENEIYFAEVGGKGLVIFLGDEPHLGIKKYAKAFYDLAKLLKVKRVISLGGVYGELPFDKERTVSAIYSLPHMRAEFDKYSVNLSNYQGGSSVGTYLCKMAEKRGMEYVGFYAFVPTYDFSQLAQNMTGLRIENDFMAWRAVMQRINFMLELAVELDDLQERCDKLLTAMEEKVDELDETAPQMNIRDYMDRLSAEFEEQQFVPLDSVWEEELRNLFDDLDS